MPDEGRMIQSGDIRKIGKQIVLPWSKAVEIAAKSMKIRFGRSVVTTLSIVLAIAFLMSILTTTTLIASLKTEPARRVVALRERAEKAAKGIDVGLVFPQRLSVDATRSRVEGHEEALKGTVTSIEKRFRQADLAVAKLELDVLTKTDALESTAARIRDLQNTLRNGTLSDADQKKLRTQLAALQDKLDSLQKTELPRIAREKADWPALQAKADLVEAESDWQLLVRKLHSEGYTDVELDITSAPPRMSFLGVITKQMDPRDRWLALLASLVCFVGIWNAMLMSVHERFREIGTMKCLGALESFIVKLYFLESSFIGLVGTLIGIALGFLLSLVRAAFTYGWGTVFVHFDFTGALLSALGTLIIGSLLSVGAAIFPARSAAKMDPIVAMRVDE